MQRVNDYILVCGFAPTLKLGMKSNILKSAVLLLILLFPASGEVLRPINLWEGLVPALAPDNFHLEFLPAFLGSSDGTIAHDIPGVVGPIAGLNAPLKLPLGIKSIEGMNQVILLL